MNAFLVHGDARRIPLADDSVQCVVTSPPYWGLRKYAGEQVIPDWGCAYGLEPTIEMYVAHTVEILREIRRVLRPDGVCFWNIGDSYCGNGGQSPQTGKLFKGSRRQRENICLSLRRAPDSKAFLKAKDLCLIPSRVALAAQADGWWVRSMIIWAKPNPMPESVTDRPTGAYEHIIMLTKSERYFWDAEAVSEPVSPNTHLRISQDVAAQIGSTRVPGKTNGNMKAVIRGGVNPKSKANLPGSGVKQNESLAVFLPVLKRNMRNVWTFPTQPYSGAHFATFPEELPRRCILAASKVGDLILDPFGGSGTTGRVAISLRRRVVLIDLAYDAEYLELATRRTSEVQTEAFA